MFCIDNAPGTIGRGATPCQNVDFLVGRPVGGQEIPTMLCDVFLTESRRRENLIGKRLQSIVQPNCHPTIATIRGPVSPGAGQKCPSGILGPQETAEAQP